MQIAAELATSARVTLASRAPVKLARQKIAGRDLHFWLRHTGLDIAPLGGLLREPPTQLVIDDGRYRAALAHGAPDRRPVFTGIDGSKVLWTDGSREEADAIVLATGYRPDLPYLAGLDGALGAAGHPVHRGGCSAAVPGLAFVGLEWQRSLSSTRCAGPAGTPPASPAMLPRTCGVGDPRPPGSTCVNIDACRKRRCCRCSNPPTVRAWRRAARR
ncbi:hypothetical protein ACFYZ6_30465 [Streptomyces rubiginosohelvolus]|uniref:hypothetical protein n=1 Tax=Streptomyces rubiginosohelvolus TaxID=67362 RepID=UPI0036BB1779